MFCQYKISICVCFYKDKKNKLLIWESYVGWSISLNKKINTFYLCFGLITLCMCWLKHTFDVGYILLYIDIEIILVLKVFKDGDLPQFIPQHNECLPVETFENTPLPLHFNIAACNS